MALKYLAPVCSIINEPYAHPVLQRCICIELNSSGDMTRDMISKYRHIGYENLIFILANDRHVLLRLRRMLSTLMREWIYWSNGYVLFVYICFIPLLTLQVRLYWVMPFQWGMVSNKPYDDFDGLLQKRRNSRPLAMRVHLFSINQSIYSLSHLFVEGFVCFISTCFIHIAFMLFIFIIPRRPSLFSEVLGILLLMFPKCLYIVW